MPFKSVTCIALQRNEPVRVNNNKVIWPLSLFQDVWTSASNRDPVLVFEVIYFILLHRRQRCEMECDVSFLRFISRFLHRVLFSYLELLRCSFVKCVYSIFKCLNEKQVIKRSTFSVLFFTSYSCFFQHKAVTSDSFSLVVWCVLSWNEVFFLRELFAASIQAWLGHIIKVTVTLLPLKKDKMVNVYVPLAFEKTRAISSHWPSALICISAADIWLQMIDREHYACSVQWHNLAPNWDS